SVIYPIIAARLQAMQTKIQPYQPAVRQLPGQCPPEPENERRMYVPSLSQSLTRRDIFTYFCAFGDLERVCVKNSVDSLNYAIVIFCRTTSLHLAIAANPHSIKGYRLLCRKAAVKSPGMATRQTKPLRTVRGDNPIPPTLEKETKKQPGKSNIEDPKKTLKATPSRLGDLNTKLKHNQLTSTKSVVSQKGDQTFVYAAVAERSSRWNFNLARSYTTLEEKEALKEGHPSAAKKLLEARSRKSQTTSTRPIHFKKPTTPVKTQEHRNYPSIPESIENSPSVPALQPPSSCRQQILSSQEDGVSILEPDPVPERTPEPIGSIPNGNAVPILPPPLNLEFPMPNPKNLIGISENSYFGPDFRYEHHCYTNVVAYQKTKLYIDLEPGEWTKRKTIKEFIDEKYGQDN
ncbi:hypothetical protein KR059_001981, partial [Drosophila kikkawai]